MFPVLTQGGVRALRCQGSFTSPFALITFLDRFLLSRQRFVLRWPFPSPFFFARTGWNVLP